VTDYAIARRIVDLHAKMEDSIDRVYEPADIARFVASTILFFNLVNRPSVALHV